MAPTLVFSRFFEAIRQGERPKAPSNLVGTFEYVSSFCNSDELKTLLNYVINRHYPELLKSENYALGLLKIVQKKQIDLIIEWIRVGFIHGVMNTDNMSLSLIHI